MIRENTIEQRVILMLEKKIEVTGGENKHQTLKFKNAHKIFLS